MLTLAKGISKYEIRPPNGENYWDLIKRIKSFLKEILNKKEKISNQLLLKWHKEIFKETKQDIAGKFRNYLVRVGSYIAPHWKEIKPTMEKIIEKC